MHRAQNVIIILCLYFSAYASLAADAMNTIALYIALPVACFLSFIKNYDVSLNKLLNKYEVILLLLVIWIFCSSLWAEYAENASREVHRCLGSVLLSLIFVVNASEKKMIPWIYLTYLVLYLGAWNYAQNHIIIDDITATAANRLLDAKLNANTMAYYTFFVSFLVFIFGEDFFDNSSIKKVCRFLFFSLFPLSFFVALVTASRQVLVIQIPLLIYMLYHRYWKNLSGIHRVIVTIVLFATIVAMSGYVESVYENSYLAVRADKKLTEDSRFLLIKEVFDIAIEYFPLGVGAGNFQMYSSDGIFSHNSYLELLANQGIVGLITYICLLCIFIKKQWVRYNITKDNNYLILFIFGLVFAFDNVFYVFYLDMWLIGFFILVATHSETYSKNYHICSLEGRNHEK